jgi:hypothetical protein
MSIIAERIKYLPDMLQAYAWVEYDNQYGLIVIIPASNESDLLSTIRSLEECNYDKDYAVIILINQSEQASDEQRMVNKTSFDQISKYESKNSHLNLYVYYVVDIDTKKAGVGLGRRLAMDQAVFMAADDETPIINLDADCTVNKEYLSAIYLYAHDHPKVELINIHYEHPYDHEPIVQYELHLRYFIEVQRLLQLPYAFHTVGSSFAVRAGAYVQVGRMNLRKAGEDFYFIHKFTKKGTIGECFEAIVIPSSRSSDRVPFGTGRAMMQMEGEGNYKTYNLLSFIALRPLLNSVASMYKANQDQLKLLLYEIPGAARDYFQSVNFSDTIQKLSNNVKTIATFEKAFYQWFDAFKLMKYLHFMRDHGYDDQLVVTEAAELLTMLQHDKPETSSELLNLCRSIQSGKVNAKPP